MGIFRKRTEKINNILTPPNKPKKPFKKWQKITLGVCGGFVALIVIVGIATAGGNGKRY